MGDRTGRVPAHSFLGLVELTPPRQCRFPRIPPRACMAIQWTPPSKVPRIDASLARSVTMMMMSVTVLGPYLNSSTTVLKHS
jgi:hypothetical protein